MISEILYDEEVMMCCKVHTKTAMRVMEISHNGKKKVVRDGAKCKKATSSHR